MSSFDELTKRLQNEYGTGSYKQSDSGFEEATRRLQEEYSEEKTKERTSAISSWAERYNSLVERFSDYENERNGGYTTDVGGGLGEEIDSLIQDYDGIKDFARKLGMPGAQSYYDYLKDLQGYIQSGNEFMAQFSGAEEYGRWMAAPKREDGSIDYAEMARQAQQEYDAYMGSEERKKAQETITRQNMWNNLFGYGPGVSAADSLAGTSPTIKAVDEEATRMQTMVDYYDMLAKRQADDDLMAADMAQIEQMSDEDRQDLETYIAGRARGAGNLINSAAGALGATFGLPGSEAAVDARTAAGEAYRRLAQKYGGEAVKNYAETWSRHQNEALSEKAKSVAGANAQGLLGSIGHSAGSVAANLAGNITSPLGALGEFATSTGRYSTLDPNNLGTLLNTYAGQVRETVSGNIRGDGGVGGVIGATVYEAGMSALDNLARIALGGEVGSLALAGVGSFGQTVNEASKNGADPTQAALLGVVSGGAEVLTEKLPLDHLIQTASRAPGSLLEAVKDALVQAGLEVVEEEITLFTNTIAEAAIMQGQNPYRMRIAELMDSGESYESATSIANKELVKEVLETAVQSFLSGTMMSGAASARAYIADTPNRGVRQQYQQQAEARLAEMGEMDNVRRLAQIVARQSMGEELTGGELELLDGSENARTVAEEFNKADPLRALAESVAAEQSGGETAQRSTEALPGAPGSKNTAAAITSSPAEQTAPVAAETATEDVDTAKEIVTNAVEAAPDTQAKPSRRVLLPDGKDAEISGVESIEGGKVTYRLSDGSTVAEDDVVFSNNADAEVYQTIKDLRISADEANILLDQYYMGDVNGTVYARGIQEAFTYGRLGMPLQDAMGRGSFIQDISAAAADFAYRMGREARKTEAAKQQAEIKAKASGTGAKGEGKVTVKASTEGISEMQKASIEALRVVAKAIGINIVVDTNLKYNANGEYDRTTNTLTIDLYAGKDGEGTILFTAAHELTHFIKQWSPEKFNKLADFLVEQYGKGGKSVAEMVEIQKTNALKQNITLSDDVAFEEFVADSMEAMLTDGEVLAKLKQRDQSIWEKIRDYITELAAKLRKAYEGLKPDSAEGRYVAQMQETVKQIQDLFAEALTDAGENFRGAEGQKNTTQEGGEVRMQIRQIGDTGRFYVQADRQVLTGTDPDLWGKQIEQYINETIRKEQDIAIPTQDGHVLLLTARSAYKLKDRHIASVQQKIKGLLSDEDYAQKGRAAVHIDELIRVGRFDEYEPDLGKKHENDVGEDGFNYFEAYFRDFDGKYYRVTFSAGLNAKEETAYSIGRIRQRSFPASRGSSSRTEALKGGKKASEDIIYTSAAKSQAEKTAIALAYEKALKKNASQDGPGTIDAPLDAGQEVLFSLRRDSEFSDNAIRRNQQTGNVPDGTMQKAKGMRERVAARMRQLQMDKKVALPEDIEGNTYIANSSYDGTEENTTVCPRSLAAEAFMDAVSEYMGRPLTVDEQIYISQDLQGRTITPECLYCYVATDRKAYRAFLGGYVQQRDAVIQAYKNGDTDTSRDGSLYKTFLDGRKDTPNMWKRFQMWIKAYESGKPMVQASHLTNMAKLMGDIGGEFGVELKDQIKDAMAYAQSASWAKKRIGYVAYNGHILKWKQDRINKLNSHYGLRMYSFSDFSPAFILENMQMITDAAVRGLKMLGYTKEIDFVKIFAPTGMNINVSTFGFESGGKVYENNIIGAAWDQAKALREKYPNVGITFVATNDTLVKWALEQDWIDVVIPYHLVRTGAEVAKALKYTNYTSESSDTKDTGWQKGVDQKFIAPTEHDNDFDTYMAALKKNHLRPRLERFIQHPGYMKLVNETRQPASKSKPVQPVFNETVINESLAKLAAAGYYRPIGDTVDRMYEIAAQVAEDMQHRSDDGRRYSLWRTSDSQGRQLSPEQQAYFRDSKVRDSQGRLQAVYHGTQSMGFTIFDPAVSDDGISLFFSAGKQTARTYSGSYGKAEDTYAVDRDMDMGQFTQAAGEQQIRSALRDAGYELTSGELITDRAEAEAFATDIRAAYRKALDQGDTPEDELYKKQMAMEMTDYSLSGSDGWYRASAGFLGEEVLIDRGSVEDMLRHFGKDSSAGLYEVYLNLTNPFVLDCKGREWNDIGYNALKGEGVPRYEGSRTRDVTAWAKANGYDGVIFENVVDLGSYQAHANEALGADTVYVAFSSEQVKSTANKTPTSDPDIRYSLRDPDYRKVADTLKRENEKLKGDVEHLKELLKLQRTITGGTKFTKTSLDAAAAKLVKDAGAKGPKAELIGLIEKFYGYIVKNEELTWEGVKEAAQPAVEWLQARRQTAGEQTGYDFMLTEQELLREVYDSYWMTSTLKTFADVKQGQINRLRGEHLKRMADVRSYYRERIEKLKQEHRERVKAVRAEDRARLERKQAELRQQYQQSRKNAMESRHRTEMRHKIQKVVKRLNELLLHETKDRHVPEGLKKAVAEILDAINMEVTSEGDRKAHFEATLARYDREIAMESDPEKVRRLIEKRRAYEAKGDQFKAKMEALHAAYELIKDDGDPLMQNAYSDGLSAHIMTLIVEAGDTPLGEMNLYQLECVYDVCKTVMATVQKANKAFKLAKAQSIQQLGEAVKEEIRSVGGSHKLSVKALEGVKGFAWANLKPVYAMRLIGSKTLTELYENLRQGEDTWARDVFEARDFFREQARKCRYDQWDLEKQYSFESTTGKAFSLSLEQIMSLYAYSKREQADMHLQKGGFVFDSSTEVVQKKHGVPVKYKVNTADAYNLSKDILAEIITTLTEEQRAFVDAMQSYLSDTMGAKGNEVSMALYDIRLFKEKNYFPLKSAKQFVFEKNEAAGEIKLKNSGFSKKTTPHASNPVILSGFMDVWANHVNDMSLYHAMVLPLEDFNRVLNYTGPNTADTESVSVKTALHNAYGKQAEDYLRQMLKDINGGARVDKDAHWINKWVTRFKKGATFASLSVVAQQPSAIARAFAVIDPRYFIGKRIDSKQHQQMWAEVKKYAPVAMIKEMGQFDVNMGRATSEFITAREYKTLGEKVKAMFADSGYRDEKLGRLPAFADEVSWVFIWDAVKREVADKHPGLSKHSEEFLKMAGERFTEVITLTQVYDSVLSRSQMMRSKDVGVKMTTAFMAEPTTTINMMADGILQAKRGNKGYLGKVTAAVITSNLINSMLAALVYAGRDDDEDKTWWEKYLTSFVGKFFDSLNPLTYLPLLRDIVSIAQGYEVERSDMALFSDIWNAWKKLDNEDYSAWRKIEDFVGSIAKVFGLPVQNIMRDLRGIGQTWGNSLPLAQGTAAGTRYAMREGVWGWLGGGTVTNQQQLYEAYLNGDRAHIERVEGRYDSQSAVDSAIRKALRENDPRIHAAAVARIEGNLDEYMRIVGEIKSEGHFKQDYIVGAVNNEISAINSGESTASSATKALGLFKAEDFATAITAGDTEMAQIVRDDIIDTYIANGRTEEEAEKSFRSSAASACKEAFMEGEMSAEDARDALREFCGYSREEASEKVAEWDFRAEFGFDYSEREDAYKSGQITRRELKDALMQAGGKTAEEAELQVEIYDWEMEVPGCVDITQSAIKDYREFCEAEGIDKPTYYEAWRFYEESGEEGVRNSKIEECMPYIDSLNLTDEQKTALALCWWAESTVQRYKLW